MSPYEGEGGIVVCLRVSEARIFYTAIDNCQLLQYGHVNDGTKMTVEQYKNRMVAPQNDRETECKFFVDHYCTYIYGDM